NPRPVPPLTPIGPPPVVRLSRVIGPGSKSPPKTADWSATIEMLGLLGGAVGLLGGSGGLTKPVFAANGPTAMAMLLLPTLVSMAAPLPIVKAPGPVPRSARLVPRLALSLAVAVKLPPFRVMLALTKILRPA